ncbi:olfactory receptor 7D4-like [Cavia porcellus]|uniref:Olfactory receptor n=1 Tax=Cavia porcellus TaxID=10141 RepID=H0VWR1_CAVPO|nr:olfactory receptor 7D4-like [Cavia porcellus]
METLNHTGAPQFLLLGLSQDPKLQPILFGLFLTMYLVTVLGNLLIILAVSSDSQLHTPMYFFLSSLCLADIGFTSTTIPKMLANIHTHRKRILYTECLIQIFLFLTFVGMDNLLLTIMAYDRFVAICYPLKYVTIMNPDTCVSLVLMSLFVMLLVSLIHILLMKQLTFSKDTEIPHFFCELAQVLKVARSDAITDVNVILLYVSTALLGVCPITGILFSYSQIIASLMKMPSKESKFKAFSTCGSHLCVVFLFYGTGLGVYLSSAGTHSPHDSAVASVMYTVVTPMLNPFIYSLRNKDVTGALGRLLRRAASHP